MRLLPAKLVGLHTMELPTVPNSHAQQGVPAWGCRHDPKHAPAASPEPCELAFYLREASAVHSAESHTWHACRVLKYMRAGVTQRVQRFAGGPSSHAHQRLLLAQITITSIFLSARVLHNKLCPLHCLTCMHAGVIQRVQRFAGGPSSHAHQRLPAFHPVPESQPVLPCLLRRLLQQNKPSAAFALAQRHSHVRLAFMLGLIISQAPSCIAEPEPSFGGFYNRTEQAVCSLHAQHHSHVRPVCLTAVSDIS